MDILHTSSSGDEVFESTSSEDAVDGVIMASSEDDGDDDDDADGYDNEQSHQEASRTYKANRAPAFRNEFCGLAVCLYAHRRLLGVSERIVGQVRNGERAYTMHRQNPLPKHPTTGMSLRGGKLAWVSVLMFLWFMYQSAAELLPRRLHMTVAGPDSLGGAKNDDMQQRCLQSFLKTLDAFVNDPDNYNTGPGTDKGHRRFLPRAKKTDMYWDYVAWCETRHQDAASRTVFLKIWNKVHTTHLSFRDKMEHAECNACNTLKRKIKLAQTEPQRQTLRHDYLQHLVSQWSDRQVYWMRRALSRTWWSQSSTSLSKRIQTCSLPSSLWALIQDGMDQAKFRVPRLLNDRKSKRLEALFRPALHVVGSWLHGHILNLAITDEDLKKDSETQAEVILRTLGDAWEAAGFELPLGIHLQQDNCYREGKNTYIIGPHRAYRKVLSQGRAFKGAL